jgi:hypothetical protein
MEYQVPKHCALLARPLEVAMSALPIRSSTKHGGITSGLPVIREQSARKEYAGAKQVMMHGWVYPLF